MDIHVCKTAADIIRPLADKLNGPTGPAPGAITIGEVTFYLDNPPPDWMRRHENMHQQQARRREPTWLPNWGPFRAIRAAVGSARFVKDYLVAFKRDGYDNAFEREARMAE